MIDPFYDSLLQFGNVVEDTSAYLLASNFGEQALNQIEPGRRCRDEVQLEARMALEPTLDSRRLVRGVVVGDQVEIEIGEGFSVDLLQKLEEFPGAMARHAFTDDLACRLMPTSSPIMRTLQCVAWAGRSLTVFSTISRLRASGIGFLPGGLLRPLITPATPASTKY